MNRLVAVVIAGLISTIPAPPASAVTLCRKASGRVVAVDRCGRRDKALTPADLGIVGAAGPRGPVGPQGADTRMPLRIVDATGRDVCVVTRARDRPQCVLAHAALSRPVLLAFDSLPFTEGDDTVYYYAEPGCAGGPYIRSARPVAPRAILAGATIYYATGDTPLTPMQSEESADSSCTGSRTPRGTCCVDYANPANRSVAPAERVDLATLGVTLPFLGVMP